MVQELEVVLPSLLQQSDVNVKVDAILTLIQDVFKEIAIVFAPQDYSSTEALLNVKAKDIAGRLLGKSLQNLALRDVENLSRQVSPDAPKDDRGNGNGTASH